MSSVMDFVDRLDAYSPASVWLLELVIVVILVRAIFLLPTLEFGHIRERISLLINKENEIKTTEKRNKSVVSVICKRWQIF